MKKIRITAQLFAPVAIKRDRQSERSEGARSVAGTVVRGALASLYLQRHGQADNTFERLFLNEAACRFGPLDPGPKHLPLTAVSCIGPLDPGPKHLPLTAVSCKREGLKHVLVDQLWFRIAQHYLEGCVPDEAGDVWRRCGKCEADLKSDEGFWWEENGRPCEQGKDRSQVATHVGIDRQTGTAAESILYTLEAVLPSGQEEDLYGWVMADDEALTDLKTLLQEEDYCISIGHHRTRGYGDVRLQLEDALEDDLQTRKKNWEHWSRALLDFLGSSSFSVPNLNSEDFYFSLSFPAGAILVDRFLRYSIDPADMIPWLPPMPAVEDAFPMPDRPTRPLPSGGVVRWITAMTRHERLRGWNAAHGLPRQDEWMVGRGAVYVYRFQGTPEEREVLLQKLDALSQGGIGLRRNEGFGLVVVSNDFHRRFCRQEG